MLSLRKGQYRVRNRTVLPVRGFLCRGLPLVLSEKNTLNVSCIAECTGWHCTRSWFIKLSAGVYFRCVSTGWFLWWWRRLCLRCSFLLNHFLYLLYQLGSLLSIRNERWTLGLRMYRGRRCQSVTRAQGWAAQTSCIFNPITLCEIRITIHLLPVWTCQGERIWNLSKWYLTNDSQISCTFWLKSHNWIVDETQNFRDSMDYDSLMTLDVLRNTKHNN